MNLLLDTHTFLWWTTGDSEISSTAQDLIANGQNTLYWSAASSWEVSIKYAIGRLPLPEAPEHFLTAELGRNRIESLPILDRHAFQVGRLPRHHRDPFDRMLIAQAQVEGFGLITNDSGIRLYDVDIYW